jgi:hypothetical protein
MLKKINKLLEQKGIVYTLNTLHVVKGMLHVKMIFHEIEFAVINIFIYTCMIFLFIIVVIL